MIDVTKIKQQISFPGGAKDVIERYNPNSDVLFSILQEYCPPPAQPRNVENVLVCTNHIGWLTGHVLAVFNLAQQLNNLGYHAILGLAGEPPKEIVPHNTDYVILTPIRGKQSNYVCRIKEFETLCTEQKIDTVILNSWRGDDKYWDLLALQNLFPSQPEKRIQVLLHFHSSFSNPQYNPGSAWLRNTTQAVRHFDGLLPISEIDAAFWKLYNPHVYCRPLPVKADIPKDDTANKKSAQRVIFIARFCREKNQISAIRAFRYVVDDLPDAELVLAGDSLSNYKERCIELVDTLNLENNVKIFDYVQGEEKNAFFQGAAIALNTSIYEGYPQYVVEAKSWGLPIVAFDIPNLTIFNGGESNGVLLAPQGNPKILAEQIVRILSDAALQEELGLAAKRHADELASFDYKTFWKSSFNDLSRSAQPEQSLQQETYNALFDALYYAHRNICFDDKVVRDDTNVKKIYRKLPEPLKNVYRMLRDSLGR